MTDIVWDEPLSITSDEGPYEIRGPAEGLDYLTTKWHGPTGPLFAAARAACQVAAETGNDVDASRRAFVRAAIEAENPVLPPADPDPEFQDIETAQDGIADTTDGEPTVADVKRTEAEQD